jgi:ATP-dependent DNA helicase RecQ
MLWTDDRAVAGDWRQARRLWSGGWLRPPMMLKRWLAIVREAEALGESTIVSGVRRLVVPLDAAHEDLTDGDTDYNRDCPMAPSSASSAASPLPFGSRGM